MVEDGAVERLCGSGKPARGPNVTFARPRVAARMIVRKDDAGAAMHRSIGDDRAKREIGPNPVPLMARQVNAASLFVDVRDPQVLPRRVRVGDASGEEFARGRETVEL